MAAMRSEGHHTGMLMTMLKLQLLVVSFDGFCVLVLLAICILMF